jgi:hypothetical protein
LESISDTMKKIAIIIFTALFLLIAFVSKPDDKKCIITAVKAVSGKMMPDESMPEYFEQFMDVASEEVELRDWIILKQIRYKYKSGTKTIGIGAFNKVLIF